MDDINLISEPKQAFTEREELRAEVRCILRSEHWTFYEKALDKLPGNYILTSLYLGFLLLALHYLIGIAVQEKKLLEVLFDWSFLIGLIISLTLLFGILATRALREFIAELAPITGHTLEEFRKSYLEQFNSFSKGYKLLPYGIFFGALNMILGLIFGLWYESKLLNASILFLFFIAGLLNGLSVGAMWGIIRLVHRLSKEKDIQLNYMDPDMCGGTLHVGRILLRFAIYAIIVGAFIAFYVWVVPWTNETNFWVKILIHIYAIWPFIASICVFAVPVFGLHDVLNKYKAYESGKIRDAIQSISKELLASDTKEKGNKALETQRQQLEHLLWLDSMIERMQTWPYDVRQRITYFISIILGPLIAQLMQYGAIFFRGK